MLKTDLGFQTENEMFYWERSPIDLLETCSSDRLDRSVGDKLWMNEAARRRDDDTTRILQLWSFPDDILEKKNE